MKRTAYPATMIVATAMAGLVAGYLLAHKGEPDHLELAAEELQQADRQVAMLSDEIDRAEERLLATRADSDSLLRSRWTLRTRFVHRRLTNITTVDKPVGDAPSVLSATKTTSDAVVGTHTANLLRADDRLIARLVLERHQHNQLQTRYQALQRAHRKQQALMQEYVLQSRKVARKKRRRTIIFSAVVASAVTLLVASN